MLKQIAFSLIVSAVSMSGGQQVIDLTNGLSSRNWETREAAARVLKELLDADSALIDSKDTHEALAMLLKAENADIAGGSRSEAQAAYVDEVVIPMVVRAIDGEGTLPDSLLRAAIRTSYNPGSRYSRLLANLGAPIVPHALEIAAGSSLLGRARAYRLIGELVQGSNSQTLRAPITAQIGSGLKQTLRNGLLDAEPYGRQEAIDAVVDAHDLEAIPILKLIAASDPDSGPYSTRQRAAAALLMLQR